MERTEEGKLLQSPLKIVLGGKEYEIKPLVIRDSRAWRSKMAKLLGILPQYATVTTDTPDKFVSAIDTILNAMPDQVIDLVFDYARDLDREAIEAVATDDEVAKAFEQIVEVAFPLARSLIGGVKNLPH